jgi:hypothetical protein
MTAKEETTIEYMYIHTSHTHIQTSTYTQTHIHITYTHTPQLAATKGTELTIFPSSSSSSSSSSSAQKTPHQRTPPQSQSSLTRSHKKHMRVNSPLSHVGLGLGHAHSNPNRHHHHVNEKGELLFGSVQSDGPGMTSDRAGSPSYQRTVGVYGVCIHWGLCVLYMVC